MAYRIVASRYSPVSGEGSRGLGGRWNPPSSFPTLYLGLTADTVQAEMERQARLQGRSIDDFVGLRLYQLEIALRVILDLRTEEALAAVGLDTTALAATDRTLCQSVGDAAHFLDCEGILAPSATGTGQVLAVFTDKQHPDSHIEPVSHSPWP